MSGEKTNILSKTVTVDQDKRKERSEQSLLSIVYDKNKTIEKLQKQLHFQKLQLKYYLGKTFGNEKILELSKTCTSQSTEVNLPVTLAVNRFYKQIGMKSKIITLYDRMCTIDGRINNLLHVQECFLRQIVGKICEVAKRGENVAVQIHFQGLITNPACMELFNNLLNANIGLRKNLNNFRICCDRLMIIEEERNMIVEQVYSLPIEQRTNCNYLIGIQIEKVRLQNKLKEILKDQTQLRNRIDQLNIVEAQLRSMQEEYKSAYRTSTEHVTDMLRKINAEAMGLIQKSNHQRERYTKEIVELKSENSKISKLLERLKASINAKGMSKDSLKLDAVYSAGLFQALDKEITEAIKENEMSKDSTVQRVRSECRDLMQKLEDAQNRNILLEKDLEYNKNYYEEAKRQWMNELAAVQRERDDFRAQVEDLQAIRAAYAQLVENRVETSDAERASQEQAEMQNDKQKLSDLEGENLKLSMELSELREETTKQKTKIARLSSMVLSMNANEDKEPENTDERLLVTRDIGCGDVENETPPRTNSCTICRKNSELEKNIIFDELQRSNISTKELVQLVHTRPLDEITSNILHNLSKESNECHCAPYISNGNSEDHSEGNEIELLDEESQTISVDIKDASTTFEIKKSRMKETIQNLLEGRRKVDGTLKIGDNSMISVRLRCTNASRNDEIINHSKKIHHDDFELLKDSSQEVLPCILSSLENIEATSNAGHEMKYPTRQKSSSSVKVTYRKSFSSAHTKESYTTSSKSEEMKKDTEPANESQLNCAHNKYRTTAPYPVLRLSYEGKGRSMSQLHRNLLVSNNKKC